MRRTGPLFVRWCQHATRVLAAPPWSIAELDRAWARAGRDVAARVALASAREGLVEATVAHHTLTLEGGLRLPLRRLGGFGLHIADLDRPRSPPFDDPATAWSFVADRRRIDRATRARITAELEDARFNLALAWIGRAYKQSHRRDDPRWVDPEHLVLEGHPWHPMAKLRGGLRLDEHLRLAPELLAHGPVAALDLPLGQVRASPDFAARIEPLLGRAPSGFVRVPVHAAQLGRLRRDPAFASFGARPVERTLLGRALLSLRTVALPSGEHLKLSVDVHTTSARRVVSPMSVHNGPRVSALLRRIVARRSPADAVQVVFEDDAAGLEPARVGDVARELGVIVRAPLPIATDESWWVCAGLDERSPLAERTFVEQMSEAYRGSASERAAALLEDYVGRLVPLSLALLARYGIALEPHLQNTLVRVRGARPIGFAIRDLGGIRIHRPRLHCAGERVDLDPSSFIVTDDLPEVQTKLAHTLFHAHLGTLVGWLEDRCGLASARAWSIVRHIVERTWASLAVDPILRPAIAEDRAVLLAPRCRAKALFRMRIRGASSDYDYIEVDNPLGTGPVPIIGEGAPGSDRQ